MEQEKEDKKERKLKKEARHYSIKDGIFATIKGSIADNYISPFAIFLNASDSLIAMFSSIPGLIGPISQWKSSGLIQKYPRKKIVLTSVLVEILTWIPFILICLLYYQGILTSFLPVLLLIFFTLYVISANAGVPAWFSWVGDIVDEEYRGRWFAKRSFIFGIVILITAVSSALILDFSKKIGFTVFGFLILFAIAIVSRIISRSCLNLQYEPQIKIEKKYYFSFFQFIKKAPFNNFGRFAIYRALLNGATAIASPFFAIYMLKNLHFSYLTFIIVTIAATFFSILIIKSWGRFSDKYGNYEIFKITILLIALTPILWTFSPEPLYLILVAQLVSGIGWAGFNLSASNYVFDCVTPQKRGLAFSYYEMLNGVGIFIGAGIGALLIENIKTPINPIFAIFIISGILRLIVGVIMLPRIREVKNKEKFNERIFIKSFLFKIISPQSPEHHAYEITVQREDDKDK